MAGSSLKKLREMTENLKPVGDWVKEHHGDRVEVEMISGSMVLHGCFHDGDVAVAQAKIEAGSKVGEYFHHGEHKYIILLEGEMVLDMNGSELLLGIGDFVHIPPRALHSAKWRVASRLLLVTFPPSKGFPDA